jgi:hypothetical protein
VAYAWILSFISLIQKQLFHWLSPCVLVYSVLGIELTLYWNQISGIYTVNTTGQLIPLVVGVVGLLKLFKDSWTMERKRRKARSDAGDAERGEQPFSPYTLSVDGDKGPQNQSDLAYLDLAVPIRDGGSGSGLKS